jgi:hypothetical protein
MASAEPISFGVPATRVNTTLKLCRTIAALERRIRNLEQELVGTYMIPLQTGRITNVIHPKARS